MTIIYYIINQKRNDFMGHRSPVKQDATYTKHVYRHIKHCVGVGSCFTGGGGERCFRGKKPKAWLFDPGCVIWIIVFFDSFFAIYCMNTDKFLSFFLNVIYICSEMSISISFSRFSVFSHISKNSTTTVYTCLTLILFLKISIFLSDLLLLCYITSSK